MMSSFSIGKATSLHVVLKHARRLIFDRPQKTVSHRMAERFHLKAVGISVNIVSLLTTNEVIFDFIRQKNSASKDLLALFCFRIERFVFVISSAVGLLSSRPASRLHRRSPNHP